MGGGAGSGADGVTAGGSVGLVRASGVLVVPGSLVNFQSRERNGAFGLAARVGDRAGERTEQKAEWSGGFGNSSREPHRGSQVLPGLAAESACGGSQSRQVLAIGNRARRFSSTRRMWKIKSKMDEKVQPESFSDG